MNPTDRPNRIGATQRQAQSEGEGIFFLPRRHGGRGDLKHDELTGKIIGAAIEVHRHLGPGLLESVYQRCLAYELGLQGIAFESQKPVTVVYKDVMLDTDLRADFLVAKKVIVELKAVEAVNGVHRAQVLTSMRLAKCDVGLLINFTVEQLTKGIERFVL